MCRVFGCVAPEPVSIRHELLEAESAVIRRRAQDDSGWGMATYERAEGGAPDLVRLPESTQADAELERAAAMTGRIFNVHVRRATQGGRTLVNTHPFVLGNYSFGHNGTVLCLPTPDRARRAGPSGETDSEAVFNYLMRYFDPADVPGSLRRAMSAVVARSAFSDLNFLFSDGERLYAYRLGDCELHWLARADRLMVASEQRDRRGLAHRPAGRAAHAGPLVPKSPTRAPARRRPGRARRDELEEQTLRGAERGAFAAERAASRGPSRLDPPLPASREPVRGRGPGARAAARGRGGVRAARRRMPDRADAGHRARGLRGPPRGRRTGDGGRDGRRRPAAPPRRGAGGQRRRPGDRPRRARQRLRPRAGHPRRILPRPSGSRSRARSACSTSAT